MSNNKDKTWMLMRSKNNIDLKYYVQQYCGYWYVMVNNNIIDHSQYRNDLFEKHSLTEVK